LNCQYAPLEQEALLHIAGPDTLKFLQGQTTCDTRKVNSRHALPGAFCTPKGRVVCDFLLCELGPEHFALRLRRDIRATSASVFGKYIVFSKAKLDANRDDWLVVAVWGDEAASALAEVFADVPGERFGATSGDGFALVQTDELGREFECYLHSDGTGEYQARIAALIPAASETQWQARQIANGIARIESATVEAFVPQILNYDLTGHISFNKGCYTGQEVVARLHYLGKSKRRTYLTELDGATDCLVGSHVYAAQEEKSVGTIVNLGSRDGKTVLLVTATASGITSGLHLGSPDGPLLIQATLPYPVESD
jgi:folate-binding protein YgfZ